MSNFREFIDGDRLASLTISGEAAAQGARPCKGECLPGCKSRTRTRAAIVALCASLASVPLHASGSPVPCGGIFETFVEGLQQEAIKLGHPRSTVDAFFTTVAHDPEVIRRDGRQGIFRKSFIEFSTLVMNDYRKVKGKEFSERHDEALSIAQRRYGVDRGVFLSFLALETDYGLVQGDFNTLNSLVTLAHDCRRPELFRPHVLAALSLFAKGDFSPSETIGAWAGEIGMIQMLPSDVLKFGQDGDGDGKVDIRNSVPDALMTAGHVLESLGWQPGQPWLVEAVVPDDLDWASTGLDTRMAVRDWLDAGVRIRGGRRVDSELVASVLLPHGRDGPAFLAFDNFRIYFEWNASFVYATTSAFFANLLMGAPMYLHGSAEPQLDVEEVKELQSALSERGYDVGKVDGIIGKLTRRAVQQVQADLGLPADAWPTRELLNLLN